MSFIYWAIRRQVEHKRRKREAMRELTRRGYVSEYRQYFERGHRWN